MAIKSKMNKIKKAGKSLISTDKRIKNLKEKGELDKPVIYYEMDWLRCLIKYKASPNDYILFKMYDKSPWEREGIVTYKKHQKLDRLLNDYSGNIDLIGNKAKFNQYMKDYIKRQWIYSGTASFDELESFFKTHGTVFFKPTKSTQGIGIKKLDFEKAEDRDFLFNNRDREFLLEEPIKQNHVINEINPYAVNTLRVNTIITREGKPVIIQACLKVSNDKSCVDNLSAGGYVYPIDLETGKILKRGISYFGEQAPTKHPITGTTIMGVQIPYFDEIKSSVLEMATKFPKFGYLGWDIAVTEDGFDVIEVNTSPGTKLLQCDGEGKYHKIISLI